jgi:SAM-dependent methyltransferase
MHRTLTHGEAKRFYDAFGRKQDWQRIYEDPAIARLLRHAGFEEATSVVEFGCGTGRLAERLLAERLSDRATYLGVDVSDTMVRLASSRLERFGARARVQRGEGLPHLPVADHGADRFLSTYVLDLLSEDDIRTTLREAHRALAPAGRLCLASLTDGRGLASRLVGALWVRVHALRPQIVGGCRPVQLQRFLGPEWRILHDSSLCTLGLCTEVLVAAPV